MIDTIKHNSVEDLCDLLYLDDASVVQEAARLLLFAQIAFVAQRSNTTSIAPHRIKASDFYSTKQITEQLLIMSILPCFAILSVCNVEGA
jgi:predicted MarR family transcription regulator